MTDSYFYQDTGKTMGPVSIQDLKTRIQAGQMRLFDLIFKEGETGWRMALEHAELRAEFGDEVPFDGRPWVCLQRKNRESLDFWTTGPYSHADVVQALQEGKIAYTDYLWRAGFPEWRRIGLLEDFNPRLKRAAQPPSLEPVDWDDLTPPLDQVVEMERPKIPPPEEIPPEALEGEPAPPPPPVARPVQAEVADEERPRRRRTVLWFDWGIVAILVLVLGAVALVLSRNIRRHAPSPALEQIVETQPPPPPPLAVPEEEPVPANEAVTSVETLPIEPEPQPEPEPVVTEQRPEPRPEPKPELKAEPKPEPKPKPKPRPPTELYLSANKKTGKIDLRHNGTTEFAVTLRIVGVPGSGLAGPGYFKLMKVKPAVAGKPIDLAGLSLPPGRYNVRAVSGELKRETKVAVQVQEPKYRQELPRARKAHSSLIWSERMEIWRALKVMEERLEAALKGQKFSARGLEKVTEAKESAGQRYIFFEEWSELRDIAEEAKRQPRPELAGRLSKIKDRLASYSIWK